MGIIMGDVINLRQARKAKRRAESESEAQANRIKHGRSKAEIRLVAMASERHAAVLAGARRERSELGEPDESAGTTTGLRWRAMTTDDLAGVVAVAAAAFPDHFEERACFAERLALFRQGCFVLASSTAVRGYLIAYPWPIGAIPPLNSLLGELPQVRDTIYLHDLALHPEVRGQGYARPIVERLAVDIGSLGCRRIALVSVNGTVDFWQGMGFTPVSGSAALAQKLASYGENSTYMIREV